MDQNLMQEYRKVIDKNPYVADMGIEILNVEKGYVRTRVRKSKHLENIYGDMHGGCLYTIADNMAGVAAGSYGYYVMTVNGSIQYLRAARDTEYIYCEANVVKQGKTISSVHVEITDDRGTLLNTAEFTYFNLREKQS